jgi:hypothetical protein
MRWYNAKRGSFEWREVPKSDEEALALLSDSSYPPSGTDAYRYWRRLGASITAALMRAGEEARGFQKEFLRRSTRQPPKAR